MAFYNRHILSRHNVMAINDIMYSSTIVYCSTFSSTMYCTPSKTIFYCRPSWWHTEDHLVLPWTADCSIMHVENSVLYGILQNIQCCSVLQNYNANTYCRIFSTWVMTWQEEWYINFMMPKLEIDVQCDARHPKVNVPEFFVLVWVFINWMLWYNPSPLVLLL